MAVKLFILLYVNGVIYARLTRLTLIGEYNYHEQTCGYECLSYKIAVKNECILRKTECRDWIIPRIRNIVR